MNLIGAFLERLTERLRDAPGWSVLLIVVGIAAKRLLPKSWENSTEIVVTVVAFLSYVFGEVMDKRVFPKPEEGRGLPWQWLGSELQRARTRIKAKLGILGNETHTWQGYYGVSKALAKQFAVAEAAGHGNYANQVGKVARSLILPALLVAAALAWYEQPYWALASLYVAAALFLGYLDLKRAHMISLYNAVASLDAKTALAVRATSKGNTLYLDHTELGSLKETRRPRKPRHPFTRDDEGQSEERPFQRRSLVEATAVSSSARQPGQQPA